MRRILLFFLVKALVFIGYDLSGQINASVTEGCAPLASVVFTSTFANPTNVLWDFDDGATSNLQSPSHSFASAGIYTVTYNALSGGQPVQASIVITVYASPSASFSTSPLLGACIGESIQFTDNSTGGAAIVSRQWDFGDGTPTTGGSPVSHLYANAGQYTVTLIVTDVNGCVGSTSVPAAATISPFPTVNIGTNPSPAVACAAPLNVSFTNSSTSNSPSGGTLTHSWVFGNGETSTLAVPGPVTYGANGTYTIAYTVTNNIGCSSSQNIPVSVQEPSAEINVLGTTNGVSCGSVVFEIIGTQGGIFNYGDGTSGSSTAHTYNTEGTFNVVYNINVAGCSAQATATVITEIPTAEILSSPGFACFKPADFTFSAESDYDIAEYDWIFTDSETSTSPNPTHPLDYPGPGEYDRNGLVLIITSLNFTTVNGCTGSAIVLDSIALPNALFYPDVTQGCAPLATEFRDESSYLFEDNMIEWEWHFGDGTVLTQSASSNPTHTYNEPGEYESFLVLRTSEGCVDTSFIHLIEVGELIEPSFAFETTTVCPNEPVQVINTSPNADLIDAYSYQGDAFTLGNCMDEANPALIFNDVTGTVSVTQYAEYNGCIDSFTGTINVLGPIGKLNYECNCGTPMDYTFTADVSDAEDWTWDFGDGTVIANSTETIIAHTYASVGDYTVRLTSFSSSSGCDPYVDEAVIKVRQLDAELTLAGTSCAGAAVVLDASPSTGVFQPDNLCTSSFLWYFGDNSRPIKTVAPAVNHSYQDGGDYTVQLFVEDENGCVDSTSASIEVFDITANYTADTLFGCPPIEVNFTDLSIADTTITSWVWNFDDGNTSDQSNPTNIFENVQYNASNNPIPFVVSLTVTDVLGCTSNIENLVITPLGPNPSFVATSPANICVGDSVGFQPTGSNPATHTYAYDYGNGAVSEGPLGSGTFNESGTFDITLAVTDAFGCTRTLTQPLVNVQDYPVAIIDPSFDEDEALCYPVILSFTDASIVSIFDNRSWDLDLGGAALTNPTVQTTYISPGFYDVSLTVETTFGCVHDTVLSVQVQGPLAEIDLNPLAICPGGSIELNLTDTADLASWQFDFGDGNLAINEWPAFHDYEVDFVPTSGQTLITLVMYSPDSVCSSARTTNLIIEEVIADFDRNGEASVLDSIHCFGIPDFFTNTSSPNATSFLWDLGDGSVFTGFSPGNLVYDPGEYIINLQVESDLGCRDTVEKYLRIYPLPIVEVNSGAICRGENIMLVATGGVGYSWQPPNGLDNTTSDVVFASPNFTTTYTVLVTDTNDCSASALANVEVFQPAPSIQVDTILRIGESDFAGFNLGPGYTYLWTPNIELECDTCAGTTFTPLEDRTYTLTISDTLGCFSIDSYFFFEILEVASVHVPDAFTPNGDGINDVIYVKGWGIESLLVFKIYNRWGELVFETTDMNTGWDGTYKGEIQNADSYAYVVIAKNYILEEPQTIKGFIDLIR